MQIWQTLMREGNDCFDQCAWLDAEQYYNKALALIELDWQEDRNNVELLLAWIAGLHNLSTLFEEQGDSELALRYLTLPHQWMLALSQDDSIPDELQAMAMRAIKITLMPLLEFSKNHPICEQCYHALQATKDWLTSPAQTLH